MGFVRWTENRNMSEYLRMVAEHKICLEALIQRIFPVADAAQAYDFINHADPKPLMVLLSYPDHHPDSSLHVVVNSAAKKTSHKKIRLALVGAGGFAKGMHLPNVQKLKELYHLQAVVSRNGANAMATAKQFNANYAATDYGQIIADHEIDAVLISTRHGLHGELSLQALQANKHVLVEKPLCLTAQELLSFVQYYQKRFRAVLPPFY